MKKTDNESVKVQGKASIVVVSSTGKPLKRKLENDKIDSNDVCIIDDDMPAKRMTQMIDNSEITITAIPKVIHDDKHT